MEVTGERLRAFKLEFGGLALAAANLWHIINNGHGETAYAHLAEVEYNLLRQGVDAYQIA
jgi:hypothetical protein